MSRTRIAAFILAFTLADAAHAADTITLKSSARLQPGAAHIALGDIAVLEGEEARRLADTAIAPVKAGGDGAPVEITVRDVRSALDRAGANWAKVNLSGRSVTVRTGRDGGAQPPQAMMGLSLNTGSGVASPLSRQAEDSRLGAFTLDAVITEQTIRGAIAGLLAANQRVGARDMRLRFTPREAALLNTSLASGRYEVQPLGSLAGDRLEFAVRSWEDGSRARHFGHVTLTAERRVHVARARHDLPRDRVLTADDVDSSEAWLSQGEAQMLATRDAAIGSALARAVKAGDTLRSRDLQRATLVKRGELVTVRCLVGGVAISLQAEARGEGGAGDVIELRKSGEREHFRATITARGEAVVDLARR